MRPDENFLWTERYRPKKIEECILPERLKSTFQEFVDKKQVPNLLLTGGPGVGKTTVAKALLNEIDSDFLMINGSNEGRLIETLRVPITNYASTVSINGNRKYVIIDEADYVNPASVQPALRNFIEEYSKNCGFIMTCNYENKIIDALHSRCSVIKFDVDKTEKRKMAEQFFHRAAMILKAEGIEFDESALAQVIIKHMPDWRRILNELQRYSACGKIDSGIITNGNRGEFEYLIKALKGKEFTNVRKWVAENVNDDFDLLCRKMYDESYNVLKEESIPEMVVILSEYQYKNAFVADREINSMAMMTEIMMTCEFK